MNSGVMLIRNTEWMKGLMDEVGKYGEYPIDWNIEKVTFLFCYPHTMHAFLFCYPHTMHAFLRCYPHTMHAFLFCYPRIMHGFASAVS